MAESGGNHQQHVQKIAPMSHHFQIGDLYDWRTAHKETNCQEKITLEGITSIKENFQLKFTHPEPNTSKWTHMNCGSHVQMNVMAGLIGAVQGASLYLNDQQDPEVQVSRTLICHITSREESIDLESLINQSITLGLQEQNLSATHIVVGVEYGAKIYCVFKKPLNSNDRLKTDEKLSKLTKKMASALKNNQNLSDFKQLKFFSKKMKTFLGDLKCSLYADLSQTVTECNFFDSYKNCQKLITQIEMEGRKGKSKAIPIDILICPLQVFLDPVRNFEFRSIDDGLIVRCHHIWSALERFSARANVFHADATNANWTTMRQLHASVLLSLNKFTDMIAKYLKLLSRSLKICVIKAREKDGKDDCVERVISIAENKTIFKYSLLEHWLSEKLSEAKMVAKIGAICEGSSGIIYVATKHQLEQELNSNMEMKCFVVLRIPSLVGRTDEILKAMKNYIEENTAIVEVDVAKKYGDEQPWHMISQQQTYVVNHIEKFVKYKTNNTKKKIKFLIMPSDNEEQFGCQYYVHRNQAENLVTEKFNRLPEPPTGLRIFHPSSAEQVKRTRSSSSSIHLKWDLKEMSVPCHFLVQYRVKKGSSVLWSNKMTTHPGETQITVPFKTGKEMEIRVAADTYFGRSEFSDILYTASNNDVGSEPVAKKKRNNAPMTDQVMEEPPALGREITTDAVTPLIIELEPSTQNQRIVEPKTEPTLEISLSRPTNRNKAPLEIIPCLMEVKAISQTSTELMWTFINADNFSYRVRYWPDGNVAATQELHFSYNEISCKLEQLQPGTTYSVDIAAVRDDGKEISMPSEVIQLTTLIKIRFAEKFVKSCKKIDDRNGIGIYKVPLKINLNKNSFGLPFQQFEFGQGGQEDIQTQHKIILLLGETGHEQRSFISGMINYIVDVQTRDPFRFQLEEKNITDEITVYHIYYHKEFRIPYSLTIVNFLRCGTLRSVEKIRQFFISESIQVVDLIGLVIPASFSCLAPYSQRYLFDSTLSIFGKDIKENILLLMFASDEIPSTINAIKVAKLPLSTDSVGDPIYHKFSNSDQDIENFQRFFSFLATKKAQSLALTNQVTEERRKLETTVCSTQSLVKTTLAKMEEKNKTRHAIASCEADMEASTIQSNEYENLMCKKLLGQDLYKNLRNDIEINEKAISDNAQIISHSKRTLREIALHPNSFLTPQYINEAEQKEQPGFKNRIESLAAVISRPFTALTDNFFSQ